MSDVFTSEPVKLPQIAAGLMPEAPLREWVENGGFNDCRNIIMKDGRAAFGPGYKQLTGGTITQLTEGTVERYIPISYSTHIGIVITSTSLYYLDANGFSNIPSSGLGHDTTCVGIFTHTGRYVSYAQGIYHAGGVPYDCVWFTNGTDAVYQWSSLTGTVTAILTTEFPAGSRPQQVTYKDRRWWFVGIGAKYTYVRWPTLNTEDFSDASMALEIPAKTSAPTGIINFNQYMIIFYRDLIYVGTQTNQYDLPYIFKAYAVRGIGMTSERGYTIYGNMLYFMCDYRLYVMNLGLQIQQILHYLTSDMTKNLGTSLFLGCDETLTQIYIGSTTATFMYAYNPIMDKWGKLQFGTGDLNTPAYVGSAALTSSNFRESVLMGNGKAFQLGYGSTFTYAAVFMQTGPLDFGAIEAEKVINEVGLQIRSNQAIPTLSTAILLRNIDNTTVTCGPVVFLNTVPSFSAFEKYTGVILKRNQFVFEYTVACTGVALLDLVYVDTLYWNVQAGPVTTP